MIRRFVEAPTSAAEGRQLAAQIDALAGEHETVGELLDELRRRSDGSSRHPVSGVPTRAPRRSACSRAR
jgi:hypothetical protein